MRVRIAPNIRDRSGTPCSAWWCASVSLFSDAMSTPSGHSVVHALHIRHRSRISCSRSPPSAVAGSGSLSAFTRALARPRVECSSSRVAMYDGHITPDVLLRHSPMFMHRSAAARMPPTTSKSSCVLIGTAGVMAASRRLSVIGAASTILPGFSVPAGSKSCFTSRIAAYRSAPKTSGLNSLRASPSPCSLEFVPPNSATSSRTSTATARIVATSSGSLTSTNGRTCRQPTDACP